MIRTMLIDDYDQVYQLWLSCKGMGLNDLDDSRGGVATFLARNPDTCLVAVQEGMLVGVIMAGHDGRRGYIYHTAVAPNFRHQGIGRRLVDSVLSALGQQGINKVALVVFEHNQAGNDFWEKCGFSIRQDLVYRNKTLADLVRIDT